MVAQHYRWDFIGLSTDEKPTPATSEKVVDGSTFYCSDNSKLYVFCKDQWYEKTATGGGGSSINVVQTTGTSTEDVMSQNAVTEALASAGGGGAIELTADDYNYSTNSDTTYNTIALWLLPNNFYKMPAQSVSVTGARSGTNYDSFNGVIDNRGCQYFLKFNDRFWFFCDLSYTSSSAFCKSILYFCKIRNTDGFFSVNENDQIVMKGDLPS